LGVKASCLSITDRCVNAQDPGGNAFVPNFNCTGSPPIIIDNVYAQQDFRPFGIVNGTGEISGGNGTVAAYQALQGNPFQIVALSKSNAFVQNPFATDVFIGQTGFFYRGGSYMPVNVLYCDISIRDVRYSYTSSFTDSSSKTTVPSGTDGTFQTLSSTVSSLETARFFTGSLDWNIMTTYIPDRVEGAGLFSGNYANAYALELSRELAAMTGSIYSSIPVETVNTFEETWGSRIQIAPLVLYLLVVLIFSITTLVIGLQSLIASYTTPFLGLAHKRITSPLPLFYYSFGRVDPVQTWEENDLDLFLAESESDRLNVGRVEGGQSFGVARVQ